MSDAIEVQDTSWEAVRLFMRRPLQDALPPPPALPAGFAVRTAQQGEAAALAVLLTRAFNEPWDETLVTERLTGAADVEAVYVVTSGDRLVATASARLMPAEYPGAGYVHWVAADPEIQGRGLGRLITLRVLQHFQEAGLETAVLETQTFSHAAQRTYLRLGFVPECRDAGELSRWSRLLPLHLERAGNQP